jgi:hypothetical protein
MAHSYERQRKPHYKSNSNLSEVQQLVTGFIMHLFLRGNIGFVL